MIEFNTASPSTSNRLQVRSSDIQFPLVTRNFLMCIAGYVDNLNAGRVWCAQSNTDGASQPQPVISAYFGASNTMGAVAFNGSSAAIAQTSSATYTSGRVPFIFVIRGNTSGNSLTTCFRVGSDTLYRTGSNSTFSGIATPANASDRWWGFGVHGQGLSSAVKSGYFYGPMIISYASDSGIPTATQVATAIWESEHLENAVDPSFGIYAVEGNTRSVLWREAYGPFSHTASSAPTGMDRQVAKANYPSSLGATSLKAYNHNVVSVDNVVGTHFFRDPFVLGDFWRPRLPNRTIAGEPVGGGSAERMKRLLAGSISNQVKVKADGQSWTTLFRNGAIDPFLASTDCADSFSQALGRAFGDQCIGAFHQPIQPTASGNRSAWGKRVGFPFDAAAPPSTNGSIIAGTSTGTSGWNRFATGGDNAGTSAQNGAYVIGGPVWVQSASNAAMSRPFDWRTCGGLTEDDPIRLRTYLLRYPFGPEQVTGTAYRGAAQSTVLSSGTGITTGIPISCRSANTAAGTVGSYTNSTIASNITTVPGIMVAAGIAEGDIDAAEIAAGLADPDDPTIPRWAVFNRTKNDIAVIREATWSGSSWVLYFSPEWVTRPEASDEIYVGHVDIVAIDTSTVAPELQDEIHGDSSEPYVGIYIETNGMDDAGPAVVLAVDGVALSKSGYAIGASGTGGSPYTLQRNAGANYLWPRHQMDQIAGVNSIVLLNAGAESGRNAMADAYAAALPGVEQVWAWIPTIGDGTNHGQDLDHDTSRAQMRAEAASRGVPYIDGVEEGSFMTQVLRGHMSDATHVSALGYIRWLRGQWVDDLLPAISGGGGIGGRGRSRSMGRGRLSPLFAAEMAVDPARNIP